MKRKSGLLKPDYEMLPKGPPLTANPRWIQHHQVSQLPVSTELLTSQNTNFGFKFYHAFLLPDAISHLYFISLSRTISLCQSKYVLIISESNEEKIFVLNVFGDILSFTVE